MNIPPFVSSAQSWFREAFGRSRRLEVKIDRLLQHVTTLEDTMVDTESTLLAKLGELSTKVDAYTTDRGKELADAVAVARTAWTKEDKAEHDAALAKIDEISGKLVSFSPSGN